jgi:hypothetical protein
LATAVFCTFGLTSCPVGHLAALLGLQEQRYTWQTCYKQQGAGHVQHHHNIAPLTPPLLPCWPLFLLCPAGREQASGRMHNINHCKALVSANNGLRRVVATSTAPLQCLLALQEHRGEEHAQQQPQCGKPPPPVAICYPTACRSLSECWLSQRC